MKAFIFARGGSKGISKKNLQLIDRTPLIGHAIQQGLASRFIDEVIISTDCQEIADVAESYGACVPFLRPKELAGDNSSEILSWQHAIKFFNDYYKINPSEPFVSLPTTSPLRLPVDIDNCIQYYLDHDFDSVLAISESRRNPFLNMVVKDKKDCIRIVCKNKNNIVRRQDASKVYDVTTLVYVVRPSYILESSTVIGENTGAIVIPTERAIDIDDHFDLLLARLLYKELYKEIPNVINE